MAVASYSIKPSNSTYTNWIEACLAVLITKEGIEPFVYDEIKQFQQKCLADICYNNWKPSGTICSSCCTENVVVCPTNRLCNVGRGQCNYHINSAKQYLSAGCPNQICHNLKKEIQNAHRYYGPSYKNTDATQWCTNPWEVAKCFMPPDGYKDVTSPAETDFNGIINVIVNHKDFQAKISDDLSKKSNIFEKGRDVGKAVRHSSSLEVEEADLQQYFTDLQNILSDPKYMARNKDAINAKKKLLQLQNDTLVIDLRNFRQMLKDVANEVKHDIKEEKDDFKKKSDEHKLELIKTMTETIEQTGKSSLAEIKDALDSAFSKIERIREDSINKINSKADFEMEQIEAKSKNILEQSVGIMKRQTDVGVTEITSLTKKSIQQITEKMSTNNEQTEEKKSTEDEDEKTIEKKALDKGTGKLVEYMKPDPILHYATQCQLFSHVECRDIEEQQTTSQKIRCIVSKVRCKGEVGYRKFKDCLMNTNQSLIVDLLSKIECGEETKEIEQKIIETRESQLQRTEQDENQQLLNNLRSLVSKTIKTSLGQGSCSKEIKIDIQVSLQIKGGSHEWNNHATINLDDAFNGTEETSDELKKAKDELLEDIERNPSIKFKGSERKCIILYFECSTYAGLMDLIMYLTGRKYQHRLDALTQTLAACLEADVPVTITSRISNSSLKSALDYIEAELAAKERKSQLEEEYRHMETRLRQSTTKKPQDQYEEMKKRKL